jgi:hypothetical protein
MNVGTVQESFGVDEDPELAQAIAASLATLPAEGAAGPSSGTLPQASDVTQSKLSLCSHPVDRTASDAGAEGQGGIVSLETNSCKVAGAPDDDETMVELVVKLHDNKRVKASFRRADRVGSVISWLHGQGLDMRKHRLCRSFPKAVLEASCRLQDAGIQTREMLILERIP